MTQVELHQAKERFLELVELAAAGEEVIIARDKRPLVKLTPIFEQKQKRQFGSASGLIGLSEAFDEPLDEFDEYEL